MWSPGAIGRAGPGFRPAAELTATPPGTEHGSDDVTESHTSGDNFERPSPSRSRAWRAAQTIKKTCSAGTVQVGFALLDRHRVSKRYDRRRRIAKARFKSARAARSARTCCILKLGECRLRSLRFFENSDAEKGRRGPLWPPPRRCHCANRSEENDRTGCARFRRRGEWDGFTEISGCTERWGR